MARTQRRRRVGSVTAGSIRRTGERFKVESSQGGEHSAFRLGCALSPKPTRATFSSQAAIKSRPLTWRAPILPPLLQVVTLPPCRWRCGGRRYPTLSRQPHF